MKEHYTFEEVEFNGQLICVHAKVAWSNVEWRPATAWQPEEGGYWEVDSVHVSAIETDAGKVRRVEDGTLDWCQLDRIADDLVDRHNEMYEGDF